MLHVINPYTSEAAIVLPILNDLTGYDFHTGKVNTVVPAGLIISLLTDLKQGKIKAVSCPEYINYNNILILTASTNLVDDLWEEDIFSFSNFLKYKFEDVPTIEQVQPSDGDRYTWIEKLWNWFEQDVCFSVVLTFLLDEIVHNRTITAEREVSIASIAIPVTQIKDELLDNLNKFTAVDYGELPGFHEEVENIASLFNLILDYK